jgi:hypothetical protein
MKMEPKTNDARRAEARKHLKELLRICDEQGTAIDGMTKEEAIAHMRRVRERLWKAKHAYHPRHE